MDNIQRRREGEGRLLVLVRRSKLDRIYSVSVSIEHCSNKFIAISILIDMTLVDSTTTNYVYQAMIEFYHLVCRASSLYLKDSAIMQLCPCFRTM